MKYRPHGINRYKEFIKDDVLGIGWPDIGDLGTQQKNEIKQSLQDIYQLEGARLGNALGAIWCFVHTMKKGDLIFVRNRKKVSIGIVSDYKYVSALDNQHDGFCHQRSVKWLETDELLSQYNDAVRATVRTPGIVTGLSYNIDELKLNSLIKETI